MPTHRFVTLALLGLLSTAAAPVAGDERSALPQWRGPARDGHARAFEAPDVWPEKLEPVWRIEIGPGHSGPVVDGERVYLHVRTADGEAVEARRLAEGALVWRQGYRTGYPVKSEAAWHGAGPFSTPLLADGVLYTFGIAEVLTAWRASDGETLWRRDFGEEFEEPWTYYGTSLSPLLSGGSVVVYAGGPGDGALVALDAASGEERWRLDGEGPPYGSPVVLDVDGTSQIVTFTQNRLIGVDPASGRLLWAEPFEVAWDNTVQTPVLAAGRLVMAAWETPARGFEIARRGDGWSVAARWEAPRTANAYSSPVVIGDRLWGYSHRDSGHLYRLDPATGEVDWRGPGRQGEHASLVAAAGRLLVFTEAGRLRVLDATAAEPSVLADYVVTTSAQWAHPALAGDLVLVRGQEELLAWRAPRTSPQ